MAQSLTASDKGMRTSRIQAWYQNPKKHLILAQFSNSPWTGQRRQDKIGSHQLDRTFLQQAAETQFSGRRLQAKDGIANNFA